MFKNVKWFTLAMAILLILQYCSVLLNMSYETRTSIFPDPFQDVMHPRPIPIPIYRQFGSPITKIDIVPDQGAIMPVPQEWAFFLGFIISRSRFNNLWTDIIAVILMNYFFIFFYSVSYELDMNLNTREAVSKSINDINDEVGNSVRKSLHRSHSNKEESKTQDFNSLNEIVQNSKKTSNYYEASKYIDKVRSNMLLAKFYDGVSTAI